MRELWKTLAFVAVALLLTGAAIIRMPDRSGRNSAFDDQGQKFFPNFTNPLECTDLEVVDYDPSTASTLRFQVKFKNGKWVIPSHFDYPADAKDRLAKTAGGVTDLTKDTIRSDQVEDQAALGVIDPLDTKVLELKGRGKRVTLRDKSEKVLADFIVGNEIKDHSGQRYVRVPEQKRTYGVNIKADLSTKFSDWIETNLLKLEASHVRRVKFDNHKVDPERGMILRGEVTTIERKDSFGPWTIVGRTLEPGTEMNTDKLQSMATALGDLKIVGVRPKPEGLSKDLKIESGNVKPTTTQAARSLISKGFYPVQDGSLYSNQGDVVVSTDEGVVYTLRFGEVFVASGMELSAGEDPGTKDTAKAKDAKKGSDATENRYVMVTVAFDPSLLPPEHPAEPEPTGPLVIPDDPFEKGPKDPARLAEEKAAKEKKERETKEHEQKVADGKKKVAELTDRFAGWYYVTPGDSFHSIALSPADLVKKKDDKPAGAPAFPGMPAGGLPPGLEGLRGLPQGHP